MAQKIDDEALQKVTAGMGACDLGFCCDSFEPCSEIKAMAADGLAVHSDEIRDCNYCENWDGDEYRCKLGFHTGTRIVDMP